MNLQIRTLGPDDAAELVDLLRQATTEEPLAFVSSVEDDYLSSTATVRDHLEGGPDTVVLGAVDIELVGMLWFNREKRKKLAHKALIWRTFVRKKARGHGVGGQLLQAAIDHARTLEGLDAIQLCVSDRSPAARKLYERHGFRIWGTEIDSFRDHGISARLHYMTLRLGRSRA